MAIHKSHIRSLSILLPIYGVSPDIATIPEGHTSSFAFLPLLDFNSSTTCEWERGKSPQRFQFFFRSALVHGCQFRCFYQKGKIIVVMNTEDDFDGDGEGTDGEGTDDFVVSANFVLWKSIN